MNYSPEEIECLYNIILNKMKILIKSKKIINNEKIMNLYDLINILIKNTDSKKFEFEYDIFKIIIYGNDLINVIIETKFINELFENKINDKIILKEYFQKNLKRILSSIPINLNQYYNENKFLTNEIGLKKIKK